MDKEDVNCHSSVAVPRLSKLTAQLPLRLPANLRLEFWVLFESFSASSNDGRERASRHERDPCQTHVGPRGAPE